MRTFAILVALDNSRYAATWIQMKCKMQTFATKVGSSDPKDINTYMSILDKLRHNLTKQILCQHLKLDKTQICVNTSQAMQNVKYERN